MSLLKTHWKNLLIAILGLLLFIETVVLWRIPVAFERITPIGAYLQESHLTDQDTQKTIIKLHIDFMGNFSINGMEVKDHSPESLFRAMLDVIDEYSGNEALILQLEQPVNTRSMIAALQTASRLGLNDISLETLKP